MADIDHDIDDDENGVTRHEEEISGVSKSWRGAGFVRARKRVDHVRERRVVPREREDVRLDRIPAAEGDSGKIETLPDGSISIPVYEEELVVTKRTVLKERVVVSKGTVTERERVSATLLKERVDVDADDGVQLDDERRSAGRATARPLASRDSETRPFFVTTEFLVLLAVIAALIIATAATSLDVGVGVPLIVGVVVAYLLSRGLAKKSAPSHSWDPREELGPRTDDRD